MRVTNGDQKLVNQISVALVFSVVAFCLDAICSIAPWWAIWLDRPGMTKHRHDGLFADCGDPNWWVDCRFYDSGKFMKTPIWLFVCQLAAMFSIAMTFFSIVLLIMEYTRAFNIKRTKAAAWMLLISGLMVVIQVSVFGGAGAWYYGIRFIDMGNNINDRVFGLSFYFQLPTGPMLIIASVLVFLWINSRGSFERV